MNRRGITSLVLGSLYAYPVLLLSALYGSWLLTWLMLGHQPRPSIDDPKSIGLPVAFAVGLTWILMLGFPFAIALAIGITPIHLDAQGHDGRDMIVKMVWALLGLGILRGAALVLLNLDPLRVGYWFMD